MAGFNAQGTILYWSSAGSTSPTTVAANAIGSVIGFNGPSGSAPIIDATDLNSVAKEKVMGLRDEGQVALDIFYNPSDTVQTQLRSDRASRTMRKAVIKLSDTTVEASKTRIIFDAYVTGFAITGAVDQMVKGTVTLEICNACTFSSVIA